MSFKPKPNIYTYLNKNFILTNEDRETLKQKRGFTDRTIDTLQFKTARPENGEVIKEAIRMYGIGDCFTCRIIESSGSPAWQFTTPGMIVIPYLDASGKAVVFYKSHKFGGLTDAGVMPYSLFTVETAKNNEMIVLCESEFKAAAMWQLGYKAIGLSGVSSFSKGHLHTLKKMLLDIYGQTPYKEIVILFDTEVQDDPECANYKDDFRKMYAQYIWSYTMAKKLELILPVPARTPDRLGDTEGDEKNVRIGIASLPKSWMIENKADIDGALAMGKTKEDFELVLRNSMEPEAYRYGMSIPEEHKPWVTRRMEKAYSTNIIYDKYFCYYINAKVGKEYVPKEVSNFIIKIKNILEKNKNIYKEIQLINKFEDKSPLLQLAASDFSSFKTFKEECMNTGDFLWKGSEAEFTLMTEQLFLETTAVKIKVLELLGRDEDHKQWIFGNMILKDSGKILKPDPKDGITFWDSDCGYRVEPISDSSHLPELSDEPLDLEEVIHHFHKGWGSSGIVGFAFCIASLFSNLIMKKFKAFPIAMLYGEAESGKSSLSDIMMLLLGFSANHPSLSIAKSTAVSIERQLFYYNSLPIRLDEYRNDDKNIEVKENTLRSVYNRHSITKATRERFGIREVRIKGSVILIGETKPEDKALLTRIVPIPIFGKNKNDDSWKSLKWLYEKGNKLSYIAYHVLKNYKKNYEMLEKDLDDTYEGLNTYRRDDMSSREKQHLAVIISVIGRLFSKEKSYELIEKFFSPYTQTVNKITEESTLNRFFTDVLTMRTMDQTVNRFMTRDRLTPEIGWVYFNGLYAIWSKWKSSHGRTIRSLFSERVLKDYLVAQEYCTGKLTRKQIGSGPQSIKATCIPIDFKHPKSPLILSELFAGVPIDHYGSNDENNTGADNRSASET